MAVMIDERRHNRLLGTASRSDAMELGLEVAAFGAGRRPGTLDECSLQSG